MKTKNIIIIAAVLVIAAGAWVASSWVVAPQQKGVIQNETTASSAAETMGKEAATTTDVTAKIKNGEATASSSAAVIVPAPKPAPRIAVSPALINYDIVIGKTPCNDKIGSFTVTSSDPSKELYWGMTGAKPIWLTFSNVEGKTPATVDMHYNCIMSGAEDTIDWTFTVVEMSKDGKYVDGYYRAVKLQGAMKKE